MSEITFDIQGEYITDTVRELFYSGKITYDKAIDTLIHSMSGTDLIYSQLKRYAEDILLGRATLKGSTREGTYRLKIFDPGEEESLPQNMNIWKGIEKLKDQEEKIKNLQYRWDVAMNLISEDFKHDIRQALGEEEPEEKSEGILGSYIKRMMDEEKHSTEDYGWLAPDGTFYEVDWSEHQEWADDYIQEHYFEDWLKLHCKCNDSGDYLIDKGWILLHNPSQGIAIVTGNSWKYTKSQKEFLYKYYIERGLNKEANIIWEMLGREEEK